MVVPFVCDGYNCYLRDKIKVMATKGSNANMRFLFGSVFFFAVVILSIVLFTYYAMRESWKKSPDTVYTYTVTFSPDFDGLDYSVYLDDSLLYVGTPVDADTVIKVRRYIAEEPVTIAGVDTVVRIPRFTSTSSLFVVDGRTDKPRIFNVGENCSFYLRLENGRVVADMK